MIFFGNLLDVESVNSFILGTPCILFTDDLRESCCFLLFTTFMGDKAASFVDGQLNISIQRKRKFTFDEYHYTTICVNKQIIILKIWCNIEIFCSLKNMKVSIKFEYFKPGSSMFKWYCERGRKIGSLIPCILKFVYYTKLHGSIENLWVEGQIGFWSNIPIDKFNIHE